MDVPTEKNEARPNRLTKALQAGTSWTGVFVIFGIGFAARFVFGWWVDDWRIMVYAAVGSLFLILIVVPKMQISSLSMAKDVEIKDVLKAENDARATLAQIIGGFAILIGLGFAFENILATNRNFELAKEGQITDRFYKAIEQLGATDDQGKPKLALRLGGIYALERIARDSPKDHWQIMEVLTAYVREYTILPANPDSTQELPIDIQAILTVISRRPTYELDQRLDLHWVHIRRAFLDGVHLEGAILTSADLESADLWDAHLEEAILMDADLKDAYLKDAHLDGADLRGADLSDAQEVTQAQINSALGDKKNQTTDGHHQAGFLEEVPFQLT
jgi:hypothetical protein